MILTAVQFKGLSTASCFWAVLLCGALWLGGCGQAEKAEQTVNTVMDSVVTRLYDQLDARQLDTISEAFMMQFLTQEEKKILAAAYWRFAVNVPVVVSVVRDSAQRQVPFWLKESGFEKTTLTVRNDLYTYEVWQREFTETEVVLGINGFDKHRPVYFVGVAPINPVDKLEIIPIFPGNQHIAVLDTRAFTYHDWDGLVLTEVPEELQGHMLLTTFRGRAREAHAVGAFRKTSFPSSLEPDQITLTLAGDPETSMAIQWRCDHTVDNAWVKYWPVHTTDTVQAYATRTLLEDRQLQNDRYVSRFTATLEGLMPGTTYHYIVGHNGAASAALPFTTAGRDNWFGFTWFGDVHNDAHWGDLLQHASKMHPETSFYILAGDLVNTGLHRDDWDMLFGHSANVFSHKPLMAVPGNHDSQDGLGASMYQSFLAYPNNGPPELSPGLTYSFRYQNALFLMIDAVSFPADKQTDWIAQQLAASDATWKLAVFHFPPYTSEEEYPDIVEEWVPLFDEYQVDMVMNGHFHYYLRTKPMKGGQPVGSMSEGTTYIMSVGTRSKNETGEVEPYAAKNIKEGYLYQYVTITGNKLTHVCMDMSGNIRDRFEIAK